MSLELARLMGQRLSGLDRLNRSKNMMLSQPELLQHFFRLGLIEKDYIRTGNEGLIAPLQRFLDGEMKNIMRERKVLENKRLDLDACKNRVRKARSMQDHQQVSHELSTQYRWLLL